MEPKDVRKEIRRIKGKRLFQILELRNIKPKEFSEHMGYSSSAMMTHLKNGGSWMKKEDLKKAATFLRVPVFVLELPEEIELDTLQRMIAVYDISTNKKDQGLVNAIDRILFPERFPKHT